MSLTTMPIRTITRWSLTQPSLCGQAPGVRATNYAPRRRLRYRQTRPQLLEECQHIAALELAAQDDIALGIDAVDRTDLAMSRPIVVTVCIAPPNRGSPTAPTSMALMCRWRSRPQHQLRGLVLDSSSASAIKWPSRHRSEQRKCRVGLRCPRRPAQRSRPRRRLRGLAGRTLCQAGSPP